MRRSAAVLLILIAAVTSRADTTAPWLILDMSVPDRIQPGRTFNVALAVRNYGFPGSDAHDVVTVLEPPDGVTAEALDERCSAAGSRVSCVEASLAASSWPVHYRLTLRAPERYEGGALRFVASTKARERSLTDAQTTREATAMLYRTFFVTTTADDGPGSLRAAMHDVNALCDAAPPCSIRFAVTDPAPTPWQSIRLQSPLPVLRGDELVIDGSTQQELSRDPKFAGRFIEIGGRGVIPGNGLDLELRHVVVRGLAINGFGEYGLRLASDMAFVSDNFFGTDVRGTRAVPNRRGIQITRSACTTSFPVIERNVISGNLRAGIFATGGCYTIRNNRLGVGADDDRPLPNGASGMYLDTGANRVGVSRNVIAFNGEMGIALHPGSRHATLFENSIWANGTQAIDIGLDGPTPSVEVGSGTLRTPEILLAYYDVRRNQTIVRVSADPLSLVQMYASDGPGMPGSGDAQRLVALRTEAVLTVYDVAIDGDLRGQWISANAGRTVVHPLNDLYTLHRTTEMSPARAVE
ncbi:MAG TPA: right-handed parallel beta-helix repeat-containing protein [Thermoanaerobaculia bacterium]|nr:right-handed parallel beta-helix repeat-containing protein [Thermoanaerobaculia bacterium]